MGIQVDTESFFVIVVVAALAAITVAAAAGPAPRQKAANATQHAAAATPKCPLEERIESSFRFPPAAARRG